MRIYISGSIYGGRQKIETYKKLFKSLAKYGEICDTNIADENVFEDEKKQDDREIFIDLEKELKSADIIFAEVSIPSLGVGYELGIADSLGKRIIAIYDINVIEKVSTMIRGNERIEIIPYKDINEILHNLEQILFANK